MAGVVLARCPDQYGVFDFPLGYIKDFFQGIFTPMELTGFFQEWEAADFARFYRDGKVIWIRAKWKRSGLPSANHWKGLLAHLEGFPEVREGFLSYYQPHWRGIEGGSEPPVNPDSESDSESESEKEESKSHCPVPAQAPTPNGRKRKPKAPEDKTPARLFYEHWLAEYEDHFGKKPILQAGDVINLQKAYTSTLKEHPDAEIRAVMFFFFRLTDPVWAGHKPHLLFKNFDRIHELYLAKTGAGRKSTEPREEWAYGSPE